MSRIDTPAIPRRTRRNPGFPAVVLVIITFATVLPRLSRADGVYMPDVAHPKLPSIPRQTALIIQHGTTQTWIIESPLDAEAQSLGWIIPVPAVPDKVEKITPGVLRTLETITAPRMIHDLWPQLKLVLWPTAFLIFLGFRLANRKLPTSDAVTGCLFWAFILTLVGGLFLPAAGGGGATSALGSPGATEIQSVNAGNYQITLLRAEDSNALNTWLSERNLSTIPEAALPHVAQYIARGWVFAASHLTRSTNGLNAPHPLRITFQSPNTVYPVKLTALNTASLPLDIFLLSEQPLKNPVLRSTFCDEFRAVATQEVPKAYFHHWSPLDTKPIFPDTSYRAKTSWLVQPELAALAWDGCWLTRLEGRLSKQSLKNDLLFSPAPKTPHRRTVFSNQGAWHSIALVGSVVLGVWILGAGIAERKRPGSERSVHHWLCRSLIGIIATACLALLARLALPVAPVAWTVPSYFPDPYHWLLPTVLDIAKEDSSRSTNGTLEASIKKALDGCRLRCPARISDDGAPGDIAVIHRAGRLAFRFHDHNGLPIEIAVPPKARSTIQPEKPIP